MLQLVLVCCCPGLAGPRGGSSENLFIPPKKLILGPTCSRHLQFLCSPSRIRHRGQEDFPASLLGGFQLHFSHLDGFE